jgi:DNA polymerase-3 subunit beta
LKIERSHLLKSLNHVHRVVERRNTIPILSNVLLRASDAKLDMKATDLDLEITEATPAMVEQAGSTTVPAHLLYEIVRKLPDGSEVLLATNPDGSTMTVASGRSKFSLQCLPETDFPDLTAGTFSHVFKLKAADLRAEGDYRSEKLGYKIREHQLKKVPYMLVVGDRDMENGTVSVRTRSGEDLGAMTVEEFIAKALVEIATKHRDN